MTVLLHVARAEMIVSTLTLPELQWLGKIIRAARLVDHATWCERALWRKGLVARFEYRDRKGGRPWHEHEPTPLGREAYALARSRYARNRQW